MHNLGKAALRLLPAVASATLLLAAPARAQVSWTDWTLSGNIGAFGTLTLGSTVVGVTYSGALGFVQTGCGTDYWVPDVYTSATVPTPPIPCDIVALDAGGPKSITFSQPVTDPLFAFLSWNGQGSRPVTFTGLNGAAPVNVTLQLLSQGTSYFGSGVAAVSANSLFVAGEVGGTVQLLGTFTEIDFIDRSEYWHGFTIGALVAAAPPTSSAPEPATLVLLATGLAAVGGVARIRRRRA